MLVLLSSAKRRRYREDILRCLAAPAGTVVQFRYSRTLVHEAVLADPSVYKDKAGVVCSVDLDAAASPCPIVPVRNVSVQQVSIHGATVTVIFVVSNFVRANDMAATTNTLNKLNQLPHWVDERLDGKFFFDVDGAELKLDCGRTISLWEEIVQQLYGQPGYKDEQFFWTVLGKYAGRGPESYEGDLPIWSPQVEVDEDYTLEVYVFHPLLDEWTPKISVLRFVSEPMVLATNPHDTLVDSPYDVKRWRFQITSDVVRKSRDGWLRVGPSMNQGEEIPAEVDWEIDLPLRVQVPAWRFHIETILVGVLISVPGVTGICLQEKPSATVKVITSAFAIVAGIIAAYVARAGIKKIL